ncbi:hypothetical protein [Streptomyces sp. URMC 129]|uniref:hypothetical protein n=1 Tax=Streptomyces sp. URMC 129 TaxID=3423407 RepID=UPI003F1CDE40
MLLALAVISLFSFGAGALARRFGQPPVIGEVLLGVLIGPTLRQTSGPSSPPWRTSVWPVRVHRRGRPGRQCVAWTQDGGRRHRFRLDLLPFGLGCALAFHLVADHHTGNKTGFILSMGALHAGDSLPCPGPHPHRPGMSRTWLGNVALASAAIDDLLAWTLLAVVVVICGAVTGSQWLLLLFIL